MPELRPDWAIDLDKIVAVKFPGKKIPKWFLNWIKRFIQFKNHLGIFELDETLYPPGLSERNGHQGL